MNFRSTSSTFEHFFTTTTTTAAVTTTCTAADDEKERIYFQTLVEEFEQIGSVLFLARIPGGRRQCLKQNTYSSTSSTTSFPKELHKSSNQNDRNEDEPQGSEDEKEYEDDTELALVDGLNVPVVPTDYQLWDVPMDWNDSTSLQGVVNTMGITIIILVIIRSSLHQTLQYKNIKSGLIMPSMYVRTIARVVKYLNWIRYYNCLVLILERNIIIIMIVISRMMKLIILDHCHHHYLHHGRNNYVVNCCIVLPRYVHEWSHHGPSFLCENIRIGFTILLPY
jgi:hypothetical protein